MTQTLRDGTLVLIRSSSVNPCKSSVRATGQDKGTEPPKCRVSPSHWIRLNTTSGCSPNPPGGSTGEVADRDRMADLKRVFDLSKTLATTLTGLAMWSMAKIMACICALLVNRRLGRQGKIKQLSA
jgi:hypothetical protein